MDKLDNINKQILNILSQNSRLTNKEIGLKIHMSGKAVGIRISNLQERHIINNFNIKINHPQTQFIRVFLNTNHFSKFETMINSYDEVESLFKTSGQACYLIICHFSDNHLKDFIDTLSEWARYTVETVLSDRTTSINED